MRKKKRPNERAHVRVNLRRFAYDVAADIRRAIDCIERSNASKDGNWQRSAMEEAERCMLSFAGAVVVTCRQNPAECLRMIANALEGKLSGAPFDEAILKACEIAAVKGKRRHERSFPKWLPLSPEAYNEFTKLVPLPPMTERAFRRRANILGVIFSSKLPRKQQHFPLCSAESLSQKEKEREKQNPPLKSPPLEKRKEKEKGKKKENRNPDHKKRKNRG